MSEYYDDQMDGHIFGQLMEEGYTMSEKKPIKKKKKKISKAKALEFPPTPKELEELIKKIKETPTSEMKVVKAEQEVMTEEEREYESALLSETFFPNPAQLDEYARIKRILMNSDLGYNPKSKLSKQKQEYILFVKLSICDTIGLPYTFFKDVYLVYGGYELQVGAMNWMVAHNAPTVEVVLRRHTEKEVVYTMRLSKKHPWFNFKYTSEMASKLIPGYTINKHWKYDESTMLRSRCLGKGYRTICPLALKGAQYIVGELSNKLPDFKDEN